MSQTPTSQNVSNEIDTRKLLLDFYSSELQTHSSLIVGLAIILFAILQFLPNMHNGVQIGIGLSLVWVISGSLWYFLMRHFSYGILCKCTIEAPLTGIITSKGVAETVRDFAHKEKVLSIFPSRWFIAGNTGVTWRGWVLCYVVFGTVTTFLLSLLIWVITV
jgi:hypothetical protein